MFIPRGCNYVPSLDNQKSKSRDDISIKSFLKSLKKLGQCQTHVIHDTAAFSKLLRYFFKVIMRYIVAW